MDLDARRLEILSELDELKQVKERLTAELAKVNLAITTRNTLAPVVEAERQSQLTERDELTQERIDLNTAFAPGNELPILDVLELLQRRDDRANALQKIRK